MLGLASAQLPPTGGTVATPGQRRFSLAGLIPRVGTLICLGAAAIALVLPWLSYSFTKSAGDSWRRDPETVYERLGLAADLNPLDANPLVLEGSIAFERGALPQARRAFSKALERVPTLWYPNLQLGLIAWEVGDRAKARAFVEQARALNPRDPVLQIVAWRLAVGTGIDPAFVDFLYQRELNRLDLRYLLERFYPGASFSLPRFTSSE
jgi:tetratricopeptide (TPR) repeat protein